MPVLTESKNQPRERPRKPFLAAALTYVVLPVAIFLILRYLLFSFYYIPSPSMYPAVETGARVMVAGPIIDAFDDGVERGDIVVFEDHAGWSDSSDVMLKRVIGIEGDHIQGLEDGTIILNGVELEEEYIIPTDSQPVFDVVVPEGHLWVMGDNRPISNDARYQEGDARFLSEDQVRGEVIWIFNPIN